MPAPRERAPDGRKGILVRARSEAWKALKLIALDREITLQDVMTEAINDLLIKHDRPPGIAPSARAVSDQVGSYAS